MKNFFSKLIPILLFGALAYQFRVPLQAQIPIIQKSFQAIFAKSPCATPLPYTLGAFDNKFGISQTYFLSALADAEAVWEKPSGINLFSYVPVDHALDVLRVNLVYDYRQEATTKLASLGIVVNNDRASYDALKTKFTSLKAIYDKDKSIFNTQVDSFNKKQSDYESEVKYWNDKGGAPQAEYDKVEAERVALEAESKNLQNNQTIINNMVDEINALAVELNKLAATLNITVKDYNTVTTSRGESFEEGVYTVDGLAHEIDIYEFSNRAKLVRVLAHELGHALGLEHVDDSKAIMYKLNQGNNEALTKADLDALKMVCKIK